jgi:uncharacterized Zn finger protein
VEDDELDCPECGELAPHAVLRAADAGLTVRCGSCGAVRVLPAPRKERMRPVPVILSEGPASRTVEVHVGLDAPVAVGDEFDLEGHRIRVTTVELPGGERPKVAPGRQVKTLYAVAFDTVALLYTVNEGELTRSFREDVPPEQEVHIGIVREVQGVPLLVKTLKSDQNRTLHRGFLLARNVRRVFADVAPRGRAGSRMRTRRRGKPGPPTRRA